MGPVWSGPDRLCQTRLIPRSPDGDNKDFGGYSFCVAMFDTTGRFCDYHFQSYFQVPIETREDWLDTADIVQVTSFLPIHNNIYRSAWVTHHIEPLRYSKEFKTLNDPRVQVHQGCYRVRGRLGIENFSRSGRVSLQLEHRHYFYFFFQPRHKSQPPQR